MNKCRFPNAYAIPQAFERKMKEIKIYERVEVECEYVKVLQYNYLILIITVRVVWVFATILLESNGHACPTEEEKKNTYQSEKREHTLHLTTVKLDNFMLRLHQSIATMIYFSVMTFYISCVCDTLHRPPSTERLLALHYSQSCWAISLKMQQRDKTIFSV